MGQSFRLSGLILKQVKVGETDTLITLLSQEQGKIVVRAKGNRKMNSHKRAILEVGNMVSAHCIGTKGMPLLTQAKLVRSCRDSLENTLSHHRKLQQILEFFDKLFVEEELDDETFAQIETIYEQTLTQPHTYNTIVKKLDGLLIRLGYQPLQETPYANVSEYVSVLAEKPLRAHDFLYIASK